MPKFLLKLFLILRRTALSIIRGVSIHTFQGRTLLLIVFFVCTLTGLSFFTVYYNNNVKAINEQIVSLRRPATLHTSEILIGMNRAATMQNGYFLTQTESFRQERRKVWERKIYPSIDTLMVLDQRFGIEEVNIKALQRLLEDYEKMQIELENYFIENSDPTADYFERSAVDSRIEVVNNYIKEYNLEKLIPTQEQLIVMLTMLSERQELLLQQDIVQIQSELIRFNFLIYILVVACIVLAILLGLSVVNTIRSSIRKPTQQIVQLSEGKLPDEVPEVENEMREIVLAGNKLAYHLKEASTFARQIGEGNFTYDFQPATEEDILGNALLQMRQQLMEIAEADRQQNWVTEGLARFVDILRNTDVDIEELADGIIAMLVRYLNAQQGTIFTIQRQTDAETVLQQTSYYAYDRKKFLEHEIKVYPDFAEGLVGQAFIEASTIYLTEIPKGYLRINSGLGEAPPKCLLLVPLIYNEKVEGVLEVASLKEFPTYQIEFVEKLAESIAATIANYRNAERTRRLLEESQEQGEEMRAQEEEMRQNVEELAATQEEMKRKGNELERLLSEAKEKEEQLQNERRESAHLNKMLQDILDGHEAAIYVVDLDGKYILADMQFTALFDQVREHVIGKQTEDFMPADIATLFTKHHEEVLSSRKMMKGTESYMVNNKQVVLQVNRFPLFDAQQRPYAVCGVITEEEEAT